MQGVMLDGPKRDRRLWLGDLRLEAQVNACTFRKFDIIERSIYLLAAFPMEDGRIPACVFVRSLTDPIAVSLPIMRFFLRICSGFIMSRPEMKCC